MDIPKPSQFFNALILCGISCAISACSSVPIRYNVPPPPAAHFIAGGLSARAIKPIEHVGVYRGELPFHALILWEKPWEDPRSNHGCRVVILSDIGLKLLDMRVPAGRPLVRSHRGTPPVEVYSKAAFLPKIAVGELAAFYTEWAAETDPTTSHPPSQRSPKLIHNGKKILYRPGKKELLWIQPR